MLSPSHIVSFELVRVTEGPDKTVTDIILLTGEEHPKLVATTVML